MLRTLPLSSLLSLLVLGWVGLSNAEACCGPNSSPSFFRHQYHAFRRGHVPGYLHGPGRHHRGRLLGGTR